jgi:hypothetical protein
MKKKTWYRSEKNYYTTDNFFGVVIYVKKLISWKIRKEAPIVEAFSILKKLVIEFSGEEL